MPVKASTSNQQETRSDLQPSQVRSATPTQRALPRTNPGSIRQRSALAPGNLSPTDVQQLQRTIGNRAVGQLLGRPTQRLPIPSRKNKHTTDELTEVGQESVGTIARSQPTAEGGSFLPIQQTAHGAQSIQRLRYKNGNTQVDINTLLFVRVLDYLNRTDPDPDPGGVIFEPGDKAALQARADVLYLQEFQRLYTFLAEQAVQDEKARRNIDAAVNLQQLLTDMRTRYDAGNLPGFREWLASVTVNLNALNVLDKMNELRAAQPIGGAVNVDETPIPNTQQTADLTHGNEQTEVKTIRQPIEGAQDFTGQVTAALGKFANVDPNDGRVYNATIYAAIDAQLIAAGRTVTKKGTAHHTRIDPATLIKTTTITRQNDGTQLNQTSENQVDKLLENLNTQNWGGANRTHNLRIILENGTTQHLVRDVANGQWRRA